MRRATILAPTAAALMAACANGGAQLTESTPGVAPEPHPASTSAPPAPEPEPVPEDTTTTTAMVTATTAPARRQPITVVATTIAPVPVTDEPTDEQWWADQPGYDGAYPDDVWWSLALCESGGNPTTNTGNGYYGAFQFSAPTWWGVGESGYAHQFPYGHQLAAAQRLQARSGWGQWPSCARQLGLL